MTLIQDLKEMRGGLATRLVRLRTMVARATAVPLLIRAAVWFFAFTAYLLAYPLSTLLGGAGIVLFLVALMPAVAPRSVLVTLAVLLAVFGWVVTTTSYGEPVTLARLVALATCLYLTHSAAALAAHLPYDAVVSPGVLLRWFARAGLVVSVTAVAAGYAFLAADLLGGRPTLLATLVGLALAVGIAAFLGRLLRRP